MSKERETNSFFQKPNIMTSFDFWMSFLVLGHLPSVLMNAMGSVGDSFLLNLSFMHFPQVVTRQALQSNQKVALEL